MVPNHLDNSRKKGGGYSLFMTQFDLQTNLKLPSYSLNTPTPPLPPTDFLALTRAGGISRAYSKVVGSEFLTTFLFFYQEILLLFKKYHNRKTQKGIPDRIIFVKNFENDRRYEFERVEFLNKTVEVTECPAISFTTDYIERNPKKMNFE